MDYINALKNKKINTLLSIFITSVFLLFPVWTNNYVYAQSHIFSLKSIALNQGITQSQPSNQITSHLVVH